MWVNLGQFGNFTFLVLQESLEGAQKFVEGKGRHGKFNVNPMGDRESWEIELEAMKEESLKKEKQEIEDQRRAAEKEKLD